MVLKASVFYCSFQETFHQLQNYVFLFIKDINQTTDANPTESDIDWLIYRSENLLKVLGTGQLLYPCFDCAVETVETIEKTLHEAIQSYQKNHQPSDVAAIPSVNNGRKDRPKYSITREQLKYLIDLNFSISDLSKLLGVSKRTIARRQQELELKISNTYSNISDGELDQQVLSILQDLPKTGYRQMVGFLKARGIRFQEKRVRRSMLRVDMEGVLSRSVELTTIRRRKFKVKGTKSLWHIDGNYKLIR